MRPKPAFRFHDVEVRSLDDHSVGAAAAPFLAKPESFSDLETFHRFVLLRAGPERGALVFAQHHAVSDGRSVDILIHEIAEIYSGRLAALPPPRPFSQMAVSPSPENDAYWKAAFSDVEEVPRFHRTLRTGTVASNRIAFSLGAEHSFALADRAKPGTTAFLTSRQRSQPKSTGRPGCAMWSFRSRAQAVTALPGNVSRPISTPSGPDPDRSARHLCLPRHARARRRARGTPARSARLPGILRTIGLHPDFALNLYPDAEPVAFAGLAIGPRRLLPSESDTR